MGLWPGLSKWGLVRLTAAVMLLRECKVGAGVDTAAGSAGCLPVQGMRLVTFCVLWAPAAALP